MNAIFNIDPLSAVSVYEQIINQVKRYVLIGLISEGDQLPSVRSMSIRLGINPNTVQKAYLELEREGIASSVPGKGCFVREGAKDKLKELYLGEDGRFSELVKELKASGFSYQELCNIIKTVYGRANL